MVSKAKAEQMYLVTVSWWHLARQAGACRREDMQARKNGVLFCKSQPSPEPGMNQGSSHWALSSQMVGTEIPTHRRLRDLLSHKACFPTPSDISAVPAFSVIARSVFVSGVDIGDTSWLQRLNQASGNRCGRLTARLLELLLAAQNDQGNKTKQAVEELISEGGKDGK